jgi:hypothetical protein
MIDTDPIHSFRLRRSFFPTWSVSRRVPTCCPPLVANRSTAPFGAEALLAWMEPILLLALG